MMLVVVYNSVNGQKFVIADSKKNPVAVLNPKTLTFNTLPSAGATNYNLCMYIGPETAENLTVVTTLNSLATWGKDVTYSYSDFQGITLGLYAGYLTATGEKCLVLSNYYDSMDGGEDPRKVGPFSVSGDVYADSSMGVAWRATPATLAKYATFPGIPPIPQGFKTQGTAEPPQGPQGPQGIPQTSTSTTSTSSTSTISTSTTSTSTSVLLVLSILILLGIVAAIVVFVVKPKKQRVQ
jgi:hypothetical protein